MRLFLGVLVYITGLLLIGYAEGGSFMAGSIRWIRVGPRHARFDIVTYWTRSFSVFKNPVVGQKIHITAQNSVQFDPGDGTTQYLIANVTKVSLEEDWFEAVTVIYHTYEQPYRSSVMIPDYSAGANSSDGKQAYVAQRTPWTAALTGCCRFSSDPPAGACGVGASPACGWARTLRNDAADRFAIAAAVDLAAAAASPDPRSPPRVFVEDIPDADYGSFALSAPVPYLTPADAGRIVWSWCGAAPGALPSGWQVPEYDDGSGPAARLDPGTGVVQWAGGALPADALVRGYHACVEACVGDGCASGAATDKTTAQSGWQVPEYDDGSGPAARLDPETGVVQWAGGALPADALVRGYHACASAIRAQARRRRRTSVAARPARVPRRRRRRTVCAAALAVWLAMAGHEAARTRGAARWARSVEPRPRARGRRHGGRLGPHRRTVCRHGSSPRWPSLRRDPGPGGA